jgi:hypothetical protein
LIADLISRSRPQPLNLHADNGNAMRVATLRITAGGDGFARILCQCFQTTTPTQIHCSERTSTGPTSPADHLPAMTRYEVGGGVCRLAQPPTPPQRHQIRDAPSAAQRCRHRNLQEARGRLRKGPSGQSNSIEPNYPLLASTQRSEDQKATRRARTDLGAILN